MRLCYQLILVAVLASCSAPEEARDREGAGGKHYGGMFNANEVEEIRSLFPLSLTQAASHRVAAQVYEGLVRFDQTDLSVKPALADSWSVDETGYVYTFKLHPGVRFHDDTCFVDGKGREFTATDVVQCYTALCTFSPMNQMFWLFQDKVLGANAQYAATARSAEGPGVKGIEALDPLTVRITLTNPWPSFLQVLAHQGCWIYPQELVAHYGEEALWHPVGTGPFCMKTFILDEVIVMERNPGYWGSDEHGNRYPFLDGVRCTFEKDKLKELEAFQEGHLSVMYELPVERTDVLKSTGDVQVQTIPGLTVQFYGFNMRQAPFTDVRIRRAFSMAIDRQMIVDSVLQGLAVPAEHGVVAPGFEAYPYDVIPSLTYDPVGGKALLADAGYANGKDLPAVYLQVNSDGFGYVGVASMVQSMLENNLGVRVITSVLPADQHYRRKEMGEAQFWREGWIVDHPDPENFLALFYGKSVPMDPKEPSYLNSTRYQNARYDSLFALALRTDDRNQRMHLLANAEAQLMSDAMIA
ncbi:MAG: ABC transporter substrate-binding protein, partial [Flavobacteriales bacterium]|nr:ABC transporter substrate-binding protein [Flavobacteriales bacterium]